eukprot:8419993-Pyramimonas_sp.AAC.2
MSRSWSRTSRVIGISQYISSSPLSSLTLFTRRFTVTLSKLKLPILLLTCPALVSGALSDGLEQTVRLLCPLLRIMEGGEISGCELKVGDAERSRGTTDEII